MAEIIFRPVCNVCGRVLYCNVSITEDYLKTSENNKEFWAIKSIEPMCCPYCGETFETILLPTHLPYCTDIMDDRDYRRRKEM